MSLISPYLPSCQNLKEKQTFVPERKFIFHAWLEDIFFFVLSINLFNFWKQDFISYVILLLK